MGSVLGLGIGAYVTAVAVNWRDRAPSEAALRLTKTYRERPPIADEHNAFVYMMGFAVAPGEDPRTTGARRIAWMQQATSETPLDPQDDPFGKPPDLREGRHPAIKEFIEACGPRGSDCDDTFLGSADVFEHWIAAEPWLLDRYQTLIAHAGWRETTPLDVGLPSYSFVADGQRLLLLQALDLAHRGDHAAVRSLLEKDIRFWREVLKSADTLLTKIVALAALKRHLRWGNLVLRQFAHSDALLAMPMQWDVAITDAERSLRRCMAGEWIFTSETLRKAGTEFWDGDAPDLGKAILNRSFAPLYQYQDSINALALIHEAQAPLLDAPIAGYENAMLHASATIEQLQEEVFAVNSPYNFAGKYIFSEGSYDFSSYGRRVSDLEGIRRAAVLTVRLRAQGVDLVDVVPALATAPLRNPYDDQPFAWDLDRNAIVFVGLEQSQYGVHPFRY